MSKSSTLYSFLYAGSMFLTSCLRIARLCVSDCIFSLKSTFRLPIHLGFGLPFPLLPSTLILITSSPTYSSYILMTYLYHVNLLSCTVLKMHPTFAVLLIVESFIPYYANPCNTTHTYQHVHFCHFRHRSGSSVKRVML